MLDLRPAQGCIKLVEQVFQPAGEGDFPVARARASARTRNWKVPRTRRLESLRYTVELDAALPSENPRSSHVARGATVSRVGGVEVKRSRRGGNLNNSA